MASHTYFLVRFSEQLRTDPSAAVKASAGNHSRHLTYVSVIHILSDRAWDSELDFGKEKIKLVKAASNAHIVF